MAMHDMGTAYSTGSGGTFNMYSSRDERSYMPGKGGYGGTASYKPKPKPKPKAMASNISLDSEYLYALTGVVIHSGTVHAGHYHCFLKDFMREGTWKRKEVQLDPLEDGLCILMHFGP